MKFRQSLKNTVFKRISKLILPRICVDFKIIKLFILLFVLICGCSPTGKPKNFYSKEIIPQVIKNLAKEEFNLEVKAGQTKNSLWVYCPSEKLLDKNFSFQEEAATDLDRISLIIGRVLLNSIDPPEFYVLVVSDIKDIGADYIAIIYTKDLKRYYYSRISRGEFAKRRVTQFKLNLMALNDREGNHIQAGDINIHKFLAEQLRQRLEDRFKEYVPKNLEVKEFVDADFKDNRFIFTLDFKKINASLPVDIDIINEPLKIISFVLRDYDFRDFSEVEISETAAGKNIIVSQKTLFEDF